MPTARSPLHALPTCGAAQALALLPPLGLAENVYDQGGKLSGIKAGQLLPPLQGRKNRAGMMGPVTAERQVVGTKPRGTPMLPGSWPEQGVRGDRFWVPRGALEKRLGSPRRCSASPQKTQPLPQSHIPAPAQPWGRPGPGEKSRPDGSRGGRAALTELATHGGQETAPGPPSSPLT